MELVSTVDGEYTIKMLKLKEKRGKDKNCQREALDDEHESGGAL